MAQVFDRSSNALARMSLVLTGLIVIALGVALDQLQRSPWVTKQGQRPDQPIPFSEGGVCRYPSDEDLYQLPRADLDECRSAGAGAAELGDGGLDPVDPGA